MCAGHAGHLRHSAQAKFAGANRRLAKTSGTRQGEGSRKKNLKAVNPCIRFQKATKQRAEPPRKAFTSCAVFWLIKLEYHST